MNDGGFGSWLYANGIFFSSYFSPLSSDQSIELNKLGLFMKDK